MAMKKRKRSSEAETDYLISVRPVHSKSKSMRKTLNISGSTPLSQLDQEIRHVMGYDSGDHLSAFYMGKPHRSPEIATIHPDGGGENSTLTIDELDLSKGAELGYVYDFGDDIQSVLTVDEVRPSTHSHP